MKMRHYRLTESRVKRIIRHPVRIEEGIVPDTIAVMSLADTKRYSEVWALYTFLKTKIKNHKSKIKVITAWRYPGKSPTRDPIPAEILQEIKNIM